MTIVDKNSANKQLTTGVIMRKQFMQLSAAAAAAATATTVAKNVIHYKNKHGCNYPQINATIFNHKPQPSQTKSLGNEPARDEPARDELEHIFLGT